MSHIFRPFPGFSNVKLVQKTTSRGKRFYNCFVEFENQQQAAIALSTLQGYKFHNKDASGVRISFEAASLQVVQGKFRNIINIFKLYSKI